MRIRGLLASVAITMLLASCSSTPTDEDAPQLPSTGNYSTTEKGAVPKVEPPHKWANRSYTVMGKRYHPITGDKPMRQRGIASWYGKQFHGKKTSNGETYDMYGVSAAHKTMELPSYAKVTNLGNGKSIIVRVNDRGPFYGSRIIDLSYEAARRLGYVNQGTAQVEVERITMAELSGEKPASTSPEVTVSEPVAADNAPAQAISQEKPTDKWSVQTGAFSDADNAKAWSAHTQALLSAASDSSAMTARIVRSPDGLYRVLMGSFDTRQQAAEAARRISPMTGGTAFPARR